MRHKFRNPSWIILVFIGSASFIDNFYPDLNIRRYIWPAAIILLGVFFILRPKKNSGFGAPWRRHPSQADNEWRNDFQSGQPAEMSSEQVVNITAIMGEVKRKMVTKSFRGGDITAFFGGAEIDLSGADIESTARLDVSAIFGGVKLLIPGDWQVQNRATAVFGGVEDKRMTPAAYGNKLLVIDGAAVFGGITIKSY